MINRRELLKAGGAGLLLMTPGFGIPLKLLVRGSGAPALEAVADSLSPEGRGFLAAARTTTLSARVVGLDCTDFLRELSAAWSQDPCPLFGLTQSAVAVLVEALGRNHGLAVVYRGWHDYRPSGVIHHVLYGDPAAIRPLKTHLAAAGDRWSRVLGEQIGALAAAGAPAESENFEVRTGRPANPCRLVSWAVAPVKFSSIA